jgi:hypothetical protein
MATTDHKYSVGPRMRWTLDSGLTLSAHALDQWDDRMPDAARSAEHAVEHAVSDESIVEHPHFALHGKPTDAVLVYRGRTAPVGDDTAEDYAAIMPVLDDVVQTVYRARSVPDAVAERGLGRDVGIALKTYLWLLGEQGGVVDE